MQLVCDFLKMSFWNNTIVRLKNIEIGFADNDILQTVMWHRPLTRRNYRVVELYQEKPILNVHEF